MAISIDIGTRAIHIIQGMARGGRIDIKKAQIIKVPSSVAIESPAQQVSSIGAILRPALSTMTKRGEQCHITLSDDKFLIRDLTLPKSSPNELRMAARQELIGTYGAEEDDVFEIQTLRETPENNLMVRAASFSRIITDGYSKLAASVKLSPTSLSFHSYNVSKLMRTKPEINATPTAGKAVLLIDTGMFSCIVHLFSDGVPVFSRYLPVGFSDFYYQLAPKLQVEDPTAEKAEIVPSFNTSSELYKSLPSEAKDKIESFFAWLSDEITKFIRFISSSKILSTIDYIYLFGGSSKLDGLADRLSDFLSTRTQDITGISGVSLTREIEEPLAYLVNAVGALYPQK